MAINVLLDACVLKKLVSRTEFSEYLKQIMAWHYASDIKIYSPKKLLDELMNKKFSADMNLLLNTRETKW